jgi:hypothetical protein
MQQVSGGLGLCRCCLQRNSSIWHSRCTFACCLRPVLYPIKNVLTPRTVLFGAGEHESLCRQGGQVRHQQEHQGQAGQVGMIVTLLHAMSCSHRQVGYWQEHQGQVEQAERCLWSSACYVASESQPASSVTAAPGVEMSLACGLCITTNPYPCRFSTFLPNPAPWQVVDSKLSGVVATCSRTVASQLTVCWSVLL